MEINFITQAIELKRIYSEGGCVEQDQRLRLDQQARMHVVYWIFRFEILTSFVTFLS